MIFSHILQVQKSLTLQLIYDRIVVDKSTTVAFTANASRWSCGAQTGFTDKKIICKQTEES